MENFVNVVILLALSSFNIFAKHPKLICTPEDTHWLYKSIEVDHQKKALALVHTSGFSILQYKKSIINKTTGEVLDQYEGEDLNGAGLQICIKAKQLIGDLFLIDEVDVFNLTCEKVESLPHQRFINMSSKL